VNSRRRAIERDSEQSPLRAGGEGGEGAALQRASRGASFRRGMRQRSPLVLVVAALVCLLAVGGVNYFFFGGGLTHVSAARLLRIPHDDYVHVAYRVDQLKQHPPAGQVVYLFGGSGTMESLVSDRALSRQIGAAGGGPVTVVGLANHAQTLAQNLVLVDNLPRGKVLLLIGLAPNRFVGPMLQDEGLLSSRELLLRSPRLARIAPQVFGRKAPWEGGIPGAFDFISSYLRQRIKTGPFPGAPLAYARHYYPQGSKAASPQAKRRTLPQVWAFNRTNYDANHAYNLEMLRQLLRLARDKGFRVALFDQPLNTAVAGDWKGVVPEYRAAAARVAAQFGVPYLHPQATLTLRDRDFADLYHLMPFARPRWQARIAAQVAALLRAQAAGAGSGATPAPTAAASPSP
jgi:hypothetical protein